MLTVTDSREGRHRQVERRDVRPAVVRRLDFVDDEAVLSVTRMAVMWRLRGGRLDFVRPSRCFHHVTITRRSQRTRTCSTHDVLMRLEAEMPTANQIEPMTWAMYMVTVINETT